MIRSIIIRCIFLGISRYNKSCNHRQAALSSNLCIILYDIPVLPHSKYAFIKKKILIKIITPSLSCSLRIEGAV